MIEWMTKIYPSIVGWGASKHRLFKLVALLHATFCTTIVLHYTLTFEGGDEFRNHFSLFVRGKNQFVIMLAG